MSAIKLLPTSIGAIVLSCLIQIPAHAAIVGGQVTGDWGNGGSYTADYTYDDSTVVTTNDSIPGFTIDISTEVSLLGLVLTSSNITPTTHTFGLSNTPKLTTRSIDTSLSGSLFILNNFHLSTSGPTYELSLFQRTGFDFVGNPAAGNVAVLYKEISPQSSQFELVDSGSAAFSSTAPVPVPTPALLPGLISFGVGLARKRTQEKAIASSV
jgi:hypothetical protein